MADISITPASVVQGGDARIETGVGGETITAGQVVYRNSAGKYLKADADAPTAEVRSPRGIALNSASLNQPLVIQRSGDITIGATLTPGLAYYLSKTAGGICPVADIATGGYACVVGIAKSASVLKITILESGVAV